VQAAYERPSAAAFHSV